MNSTNLILLQYPPGFGMSSLSPFCLKVESYLRLCKLTYDVRQTNNPKLGPFGKMPVLIDGPLHIPDSRFIIASINKRTEGGKDCHLNKRQLAVGHAICRMIEEHLYFVIMYIRWVDGAGFRACSREFAQAFPFGTRTLALWILRSMLIRQCRAQGIGRLDRERIFELALQDIGAIERLVTGPFLFGDTPTSFDCTIYAFLKTILNFEIENPLQGKIRESENLMNLVIAMERECWNSTAKF